jgi:hypothetical protein
MLKYSLLFISMISFAGSYNLSKNQINNIDDVLFMQLKNNDNIIVKNKEYSKFEMLSLLVKNLKKISLSSPIKIYTEDKVTHLNTMKLVDFLFNLGFQDVGFIDKPTFNIKAEDNKLKNIIFSEWETYKKSPRLIFDNSEVFVEFFINKELFLTGKIIKISKNKNFNKKVEKFIKKIHKKVIIPKGYEYNQKFIFSNDE